MLEANLNDRASTQLIKKYYWAISWPNCYVFADVKFVRSDQSSATRSLSARRVARQIKKPQRSLIWCSHHRQAGCLSGCQAGLTTPIAWQNGSANCKCRTEVLNRRYQSNKKLNMQSRWHPTKLTSHSHSRQPQKVSIRQPPLPNHVWHFNHNKGATGI